MELEAEPRQNLEALPAFVVAFFLRFGFRCICAPRPLSGRSVGPSCGRLLWPPSGGPLAAREWPGERLAGGLSLGELFAGLPAGPSFETPSGGSGAAREAARDGLEAGPGRSVRPLVGPFGARGGRGCVRVAAVPSPSSNRSKKLPGVFRMSCPLE